MGKTTRRMFAGASATALFVALLGGGVAFAGDSGLEEGTESGAVEQLDDDDAEAADTEAEADAGEPAGEPELLDDGGDDALPVPDFLSIEDFWIYPESYTGPCRFDGYVGAYMEGEYYELGYDWDDLTWRTTFMNSEGEPLLNSSGEPWIEVQRDFPFYGNHFWVSSSGYVYPELWDDPFQIDGNTLKIRVELIYQDKVLDSKEGDLDYEITSGCAKIVDVQWESNPVKIAPSAKTASATMSGKLVLSEDADGYEGYSLDAYLYGDDGEFYVLEEDLEVASDGTWSVTFTEVPEGTYEGYVTLWWVDGEELEGRWNYMTEVQAQDLKVVKESAPSGGAGAGTGGADGGISAGAGAGTSGSGELAATGANAGAIWGAGAFIALGAAMTLLSRRRTLLG